MRSGKKRAARIAAMALTVALAVIGLSGCAKAGESPDAKYAALINLTLDGALEKLGVKETDVQNPAPGLYLLPGTEKAYGGEFSAALLVDVRENTVYGFRYSAEFQGEDAAKQAAERLGKLCESLQAEYGEASTYPGLENRFADAEDPAAALNAPGASLLERWDVSGKLRVDSFGLEARAETTSETEAVVSLNYQLALSR